MDGFKGMVIEMTSTWSRDDRLATGADPPVLRIGRDSESNHIAITINDRTKFTMSDEMRDRLIVMMGAL